MLHVLAYPTYRPLFIARVVALVGTGLATVALGLLAYDLAGANAGAVLGTTLAIIISIVHRFTRSFRNIMKNTTSGRVAHYPVSPARPSEAPVAESSVVLPLRFGGTSTPNPTTKRRRSQMRVSEP